SGDHLIQQLGFFLPPLAQLRCLAQGLTTSMLEAKGNGAENQTAEECSNQRLLPAPAKELARPIKQAGGTCLNRLVSKVVLKVVRQIKSGVVPAIPILLEGLHDYQVEIPADEVD